MAPVNIESNQKSFNPCPTLGLPQLVEHCSKYHRDTPMVFATGKHFVFESGSEPLDVILVYKNEGNPCEREPPHWHYISLGLSDIHNYSMTLKMDKALRKSGWGSIGPQFFDSYNPLQDRFPPEDLSVTSDEEKLSGFGFEFSFRLKYEPKIKLGQSPPQWPIDMMQHLARYVFETNNVFSEGHHIEWHKAIAQDTDSQINHFIFTKDSQMDDLELHSGKVSFIQIVGVTNDELEAAQQWSAKGIISMMKKLNKTGNRWLVTDMSRSQSILEIDPEYTKSITSERDQIGSDVYWICRHHRYSLSDPDWLLSSNLKSASANEDSVIHFSNQTNKISNSRSPSQMRLDNIEHVCYPEKVFMLIDLHLTKIMHCMIKYRLCYNKRFMISNPKGDRYTTFVPEHSCDDTNVNEEVKIAEYGPTLEIFVDRTLMEELMKITNQVLEMGPSKLPITWTSRQCNLHLTFINQSPN